MTIKIDIKKVIPLFLAVIVFVCLFSYTINVSKVYTSLNIDSKTKTTNNLTTTVLFWTAFFTDKRWLLPADTITLKCPLAECTFTNDLKLLPSLNMYDAVVFHTARNFKSIPNVRAAHQLYIMAQLESPEHTLNNFSNKNKFFNLTMTYRFDSDIVWSYNHVFDRETNAVVAPSLIQQWRRINSNWTQTDQQLLTMINAKNKLVAWPVSNCKSASEREKLVKKLQKRIQVDIFGKCGKMKCTRHNSECDDLLDKSYKFYLSFENSLCIDYVTEKLYDALQRNVVPIVYGGANYSYFAPPHSYIDAQSFPNVSALADYILYLNDTPLEYVKYFWWKRFYKVPVHFEPPVPYCDLCHRINSRSTQERTQIYRDINSYWHSGTCTKKPKIYF